MTDTREWERDKERFVAAGQEGGVEPGPLARQFLTLTRELLDARTVEDVLTQVVRAVTVLIPAADMVSVTVRDPEGNFHTPVRTDPVADRLDELQYEFDEGPCHDSALPEGPASAHSADLRHTDQWPRWAPAADELGAGAVLSTALVPDAIPPDRSGALNIYSRRPHGLDTTDVNQVLLLATHASLALARTEAVTRAELHEAQLRRAIDSRDVIGQAKGIIMARRGIAAEEAFDILRQSSQRLNVKLVEVAATLTARHTEL
ncbi:GAF and ANTAR domain-containing protein [Actinophytocola oryzae]|uniref:GAF domain-containing protein n=1 Tax=Actinophytocola oryzae TaxID=502181 RepID=A0A4R7UQK0_9PSEU|nr:GAF and ANTAR domain-containing protein [Actinophytocola oryzae]TDV35298.1 GAF domain-containing protein [Actinophytocola oryzae]